MVDLWPVDHNPFADDYAPVTEFGRLPDWLGRAGGVIRGAGSALGEDIGNLAAAMSPQGYLENYGRLIGDQPNAPAAFRNPSDIPGPAPSAADIAGFLSMHLAGGAPADTLSAGIRAYHGSPHDFPAFDATKIGTGEGAQAYGHGLYFAENEATGRAYRSALISPGKVYSDAIDATDLPFSVKGALQSMPFDQASPERLVSGAYAQFPEARADLRPSFEAILRGEHAGDPVVEAVRSAQRAAKNAGHTYEVDLNVDPEHLLDWDKPLSQQSEHVKNALGPELDPDTEAMRSWGGAEFYRELGRDQMKLKNAASPTGGVYDQPTGDALSSQRLRDLGIPGIRYLDQGSRAAGEGSHNYVIFDDKLIDILKKYGLGGLVAGGAMAVGGNADAATHAVPVDHQPDFGP